MRCHLWATAENNNLSCMHAQGCPFCNEGVGVELQLPPRPTPGGQVWKKMSFTMDAKMKLKRWHAFHNGLLLVSGFPVVKVGSKQFLEYSIRGPRPLLASKTCMAVNVHIKKWRERFDWVNVWTPSALQHGRGHELIRLQVKKCTVRKHVFTKTFFLHKLFVCS